MATRRSTYTHSTVRRIHMFSSIATASTQQGQEIFVNHSPLSRMDCLYLIFRVSCVAFLLTIPVQAKKHSYMLHDTMEEIASKEQQHHHFVLVHGMNHGAWCWYKVATALRRAGHRATALDMAGCGVNPARVEEVRTFEEYTRPLLDAMAALPPGERAVLVAHSHGGYSVALAVESFPEKVAAAVFVTASMPAIGRAMAATSDELLAYVGPDFFMDSRELEQKNPKIKGKPFILGPNFMAQRLYHLSPPEDLTLGLMLIRPANAFTTSNPDEATMRDEKLLTAERYGSARRVFVVVEDDRALPVGFQRRMIVQSPGVEVEEMAAGGADHMAMLSRPEELVEILMRIASKSASE